MTPITRVQSLVCSLYEVTLADLLGRDKHKTIAEARCVAMFMCRIHLPGPPSFPEIGRAFANRDHTTVMSAVRRALVLQGRDPSLCARVAALAAAMGSAPTGAEDISRLPGLAKIDLDDDYLTERAARFAGSGAE